MNNLKNNFRLHLFDHFAKSPISGIPLCHVPLLTLHLRAIHAAEFSPVVVHMAQSFFKRISIGPKQLEM